MKASIKNLWDRISHSPWRWAILAVVLLGGGLVCLGPLLFMSVGSGGVSYEAAMQAPAAMPVEEMVEREVAMESSGADAALISDVLASAVSQAQQQTRLIIYTGNIGLVVKDTAEAVAAISELATQLGGYVAGSNIYQTNQVPAGSITIRVPAERYEETLQALRALAIRVEREQSDTQDITEEFTDLQARKSNLEAAERALQELLTERERVGSTADILEVYRELTNLRGQIEQIEGRLRYLTNQAALSTITIELIPDILYQPVQIAGWEPQGVAREALRSLIVALQGLGSALIWLVVFVLPLLILGLLVLWVAIWLGRWLWRRWFRPKATA
jgi:hypothetical protein